MTKIEVMDVLAKMDLEDQRYAHKLLCKVFAGRRIYTQERLPKLMDILKKRADDSSKLRKELMSKFNDKELVSEIMDMYAPEKPLVPTNAVYNVLSDISDCVSAEWLMEHGIGLHDYDYDAICEALNELCLDGLADCVADGDKLVWWVVV